jgi:hypothetical protein
MPESFPVPYSSNPYFNLTISGILLIFSFVAMFVITFLVDVLPENEIKNYITNYLDVYILVGVFVPVMVILLVSLFRGKDLSNTSVFVGYTFGCLSLIVLFFVTLFTNRFYIGGSHFTMFVNFVIMIAALLLVFFGSTGVSSLHSVAFFIGYMLLVLNIYIFISSSGNPQGVFSSISDDAIRPRSQEYQRIYTVSGQKSGAFKRTLFDQVYLSIVYPTLSATDAIPLHNTKEFGGSHSLTNYAKHLKDGGSAFVLDAYFETNTNSPNLNTWRIGTLNTVENFVQSRRTISVDSVLRLSDKAVSQDERVIFLFLNPRYPSNATNDEILHYETKLAEVIRQSVTHLTLPSLFVTDGTDIKLENVPIDQAKHQVVIYLGGTRKPVQIHESLRKVIHGIANFTNVSIRPNVSPENMMAYDPNLTNLQDLGNVKCANESRVAEIIPIDTSTKMNTHFAATLPTTTEINKDGTQVAYIQNPAVYITHNICFPFVYPFTVTADKTRGNGVIDNEAFMNGFNPIFSPNRISSMIFNNEQQRDGNNPVQQRSQDDLRCNETIGSAKVLNPEHDSDWGSFLEYDGPTQNVFDKKQWCSRFTNKPQQLSTESQTGSRLILYRPDTMYSGGMIPKPAIVQTTTGEVYQLRNIVQYTNIESENIS